MGTQETVCQGDVIPHNGKKGINDVGKNVLINLKHLHHSSAMNLMYFLLVSSDMFIRFSLWCRKFRKQFFFVFSFFIVYFGNFASFFSFSLFFFGGV